jgi:hypothetical protein
LRCIGLRARVRGGLKVTTGLKEHEWFSATG